MRVYLLENDYGYGDIEYIGVFETMALAEERIKTDDEIIDGNIIEFELIKS